ncbi:MAG: hypothetical protein J5613_02210 [Alphaproteobacteria bacterium]|nr:hypothetical protein [Alphaproteobacteria bacterium]
MVEYKSVVLKFGGSVISDENAVYRVADLVKTLSEQYKIKAIVVSAMGKTTNYLDQLAHKVANKPDKRELDALLATGEMQSAALLSMRLNDIDVPAYSYNAQQFGILTDDNFGNATIQRILWTHVNTLKGIPVVAGFQGVDKFDNYTTLGREGSDISAVWVATVMTADFCWFFKDGGGIYDKNPNENPDARLFKELSYTKMLNIVHNKRGKGQVLHKRSIDYAKDFNKPLFVSGIDDPYVGTLIKARVHSKFH